MYLFIYLFFGKHPALAELLYIAWWEYFLYSRMCNNPYFVRVLHAAVYSCGAKGEHRWSATMNPISMLLQTWNKTSHALLLHVTLLQWEQIILLRKINLVSQFERRIFFINAGYIADITNKENSHIAFHRVAHNCNYFLVHRLPNTVTVAWEECWHSSLIPEPFLLPVFDAASDQRGSWR